METITSIAVYRRDALNHVEPFTAFASILRRANTPTICLACIKSNEDGTKCTDGCDMHGEVEETWQYGSSPDTPLEYICAKFVSVRVFRKKPDDQKSSTG